MIENINKTVEEFNKNTSNLENDYKERLERIERINKLLNRHNDKENK